MSRAPAALLSVQGLSQGFDGVQAVGGLSFAIAPGGITALIGPNGAGKTTVFNAISGYVRPDAGSIQFEGAEISRSRPDAIARMGMGRTFQDCRTFLQLSVMDNVLLGFEGAVNESFRAAMVRAPTMLASEREKRQRAGFLLDQVGLLGRKDDLAENLSYGERKLLELCRVQALDPKLVLLDEPMAGLFPVMILTLMKVIRRLRDAGRTIFLIEHNMKVVMEISDRVLVLNYGQLIAEGDPSAVQTDPAVLDAYLGGKSRGAS